MANVVVSGNKSQHPGNKNCKELVMQVLVNLKFSNGDFQHGFEKIMLCAGVADCEKSTELEVKLPAAPLIPGLYQSWQDKYSELVGTSGRKVLSTSDTENSIRGFLEKSPTNVRYFSYEKCQNECNQYAENLRIQINQWLTEIKSQLETKFELDKNSDILLTINTENISSQITKDILHRLPWREWDYFNQNSAFEAVLCLSESQSSQASVVDSGTFRRVRITSIFGDSTDIDVNGDRQLIAKLQKRGAELVNLEQPQRQDFIKLWDEPCDILFYSGHSESSPDGTFGSLQINSKDNLNLKEIRNTFSEAIRKGLKLAIFNSCDGLGLAKQLADLRLPYVIVWREPVPDKIAQKFIEYFLSSYADGKSLFNSVRDARIKLIELTNSAQKEKQIPGLEWLPIICKNTIDTAPTWEDLGGLTGKLPNSPYQGLSAFGEEEKEYFFGRDKFVGELLEAINTKSLVPIIGASGSGKSSVVFAGLVPRLREIGMQIVSFRPGSNPFDSLAVALKQQISPVRSHSLTRGGLGRLEELELEVNLENDEQALCRFIENLKNLTSQRFILIIDQFEELYTLTPEAQQQSFLNTLLYAVKHAPNFCLIFTLRADFYGHAISHPTFSNNLDNNSHNCSPMSSEELRAVIEQPAAKLKVELEQGLAKKLIDDLGNQPGRLPLLEFTLSLLWEKHDKWYLTHKAYEEIGCLEKALAKYADGVLNPLSVAQKEKAERIFIQLIRPGEGTEDTKRKATRGEVGEENWGLVEELANQRLVVTGWDEISQQETVEIVHEALIREWGMLREWIQSNRRFRIWQERLQFEVVKCDKNLEEKYLLSGGNLGEAEGWYFDEKYRDYLSDVQGEFIRESLDARDRKIKEEKRRQRRTILGFAGFSIVSLAFAGFVGWNLIQSEIRGTQEKLNSSIATSKNSLNSENYGDAQFEALQAKQLLETTWWKQWIPTHIKQKVNIALHQPINLRSEAKYTFEGHKASFPRVVFSPDGKTIAFASHDNTVKLWSVDGQLFHTLKGHESSPFGVSIAFSPDGKTIAFASHDNTVKLWSVDGQLLNILSGHKHKVLSIIFSPDGKTIATASLDRTVKLWSAADGQILQTLSEHKDLVSTVVFSQDGKTIASASLDRTVKLWSAANGQLLHTFKGHKDPVWSVIFSPDGKTIASASADGTVKLWSVKDGQLLHTSKGDGHSLSFSPDGKTIAWASQTTVKLWSAADGQLLHTLSRHKDQVWRVIFSPDGKTIASASADGTVKLWSATDGQLLHTFEGHEGSVNSVEFSPDGTTIASASYDGVVKLWSVADAQLFHTLEGDRTSVWSVVFNWDGKTIASVSSGRTVKLWSLDGQLFHTLKGHENDIISLEFSPDGKTIASASADRIVKLWSVDGQLLRTLKGNKSFVLSIAFSPDGKTIATASSDKTVKLWSAIDGQLLHTFKGHKDRVSRVVFSPDGKTIASASADRTVKLWSVKDGQLLHTFEGHKNQITSVVFSPDGKTIASASADRTVKLWSAADALLLYTLEGHKTAVSRIAFSPDGKTIASVLNDGTVKLWNWNFDNLLTRGCNKLQGYLIEHPEKLEELKVCQNPEMLAKAASNLVKQGEELAKNGNSQGAVERFRKAKKWNPKLDINPEEKAKRKN